MVTPLEYSELVEGIGAEIFDVRSPLSERLGCLDYSRLGGFGWKLEQMCRLEPMMSLILDNVAAFNTARVDGLAQWVLDSIYGSGAERIPVQELNENIWTLGARVDGDDLALAGSFAVVGVVCQWDVELYFESYSTVLQIGHSGYIDVGSRSPERRGAFIDEISVFLLKPDERHRPR